MAFGGEGPAGTDQRIRLKKGVHNVAQRFPVYPPG
jgi:hypothetical protein